MDITIQELPEDHDDESPNPFLAQPSSDKEEEDEEDDDELCDLLEITFQGAEEIPEKVRKHIEGKIGTFETRSEGENTTLIFEVNFNQIDKTQIWNSYKNFFRQREGADKNTSLKISFEKKGEMKDLIEGFKAKKEIPLILHLLQRGILRAEIETPEYLLKSGSEFIKEQFPKEMSQILSLLDRFKSFKGELKLGGMDTIDIGFWKRLDLDQTQNFGGFFDVWRTPLLRHIFGDGEKEVKIQGTVFQFFEYEFKMKIKDFKSFLDEMSKHFK